MVLYGSPQVFVLVIISSLARSLVFLMAFLWFQTRVTDCTADLTSGRPPTNLTFGSEEFAFGFRLALICPLVRYSAFLFCMHGLRNYDFV